LAHEYDADDPESLEIVTALKTGYTHLDLAEVCRAV
jgi:hypothetical protein